MFPLFPDDFESSCDHGCGPCSVRVSERSQQQLSVGFAAFFSQLFQHFPLWQRRLSGAAARAAAVAPGQHRSRPRRRHAVRTGHLPDTTQSRRRSLRQNRQRLSQRQRSRGERGEEEEKCAAFSDCGKTNLLFVFVFCLFGRVFYIVFVKCQLCDEGVCFLDLQSFKRQTPLTSCGILQIQEKRTKFFAWMGFFCLCL